MPLLNGEFKLLRLFNEFNESIWEDVPGTVVLRSIGGGESESGNVTRGSDVLVSCVSHVSLKGQWKYVSLIGLFQIDYNVTSMTYP